MGEYDGKQGRHRGIGFVLHGSHPFTGLLQLHRAYHRHPARRSFGHHRCIAGTCYWRRWASPSWGAGAAIYALWSYFLHGLVSLPRSGGWLNSVKVTLDFELALALKFLSNVDLAYHWNWSDREIFLSLWIILFGLLGCYLLGKIRFAYDSPLSHSQYASSWPSFGSSFTLYLVLDYGCPLKSCKRLSAAHVHARFRSHSRPVKPAL